MPLVDTSTEFGQRVQRRLTEERVIWLTTQGKDGTPQPSPVWFLWKGDNELVIYSQRNKPKVRNIEARPSVALTLNSTSAGNNVVILHGEGRVDEPDSAASDYPAFVDKYAEGISGIGMTPQSFADEYSAPIRVRLTKVRGH